MDAQPSRDLPPVVEEAYQPSTSRSPVAPVGRNGWQVIETAGGASGETLYYNATTGETALHPPSDLSEGWVGHPSAPTPRQSCLLVGRPSRKAKRQTADGLIAYLLATSEEFAKAYVQRREHVSGASTHRAPPPPPLVLSPRREASGNASSSAAGADGAGSLPPVKSRLRSSKRSSNGGTSPLLTPPNSAIESDDGPVMPWDEGPRERRRSRERRNSRDEMPKMPRAAQGAAGAEHACGGIAAGVPPTCHVAASTMGLRLPSVLSHAPKHAPAPSSARATQMNDLLDGTAMAREMGLRGSGRSSPRKGNEYRPYEELALRKPPAWDFDHVKLQLLDRAALKCDRNFDRWNLVRLYTPNSRGGAKRIVPENCESPRAFYAEGLHRTPRPPSHPQRPAAIGPWGTGGGSLSARTPRIVNLEVLTLNARPQLSARQLV